MAQSYAHILGELLGNFFETTMVNYLRPFAENHGFYFDYKHPRTARNQKPDVVWTDIDGNRHKLDVVFEMGGNENVIGTPKAFIEIAWRSYAKHSKNKVQEISGALIPLRMKYKKHLPFFGAILAGVFTQPSIIQLQSQGFNTLHFPYDAVVQAFQEEGINVSWQEDTSEIVLSEKVQAFRNLTQEQRENIAGNLINDNEALITPFITRLESAMTRRIERISITPLHGRCYVLNTIEEAVDFLTAYNETECRDPLCQYIIDIRYNNGDKIEVCFNDRQNSLDFLQDYI